MDKGDIPNIERYNRYAEDWRFQHNLIWEIPGVTIAIIAGILTVAFSFLGPSWPRFALLFLGTTLIFGLAVAVFKHRFTADVRTSFLDDIGKDRHLYPVRSDEALEYMKKKRDEVQPDERSKELGKNQGEEKVKDLKPEFMIKWQSEKFLIGFMFIAFAVLLSLSIYTLMELCCGWVPLEIQDKNMDLKMTDMLLVQG